MGKTSVPADSEKRAVLQMTVHISKNFLNLPKIKVPLILGIWGGKGQGKTFQCMLAYKKLAIQPIVMSAGANFATSCLHPSLPSG
jgi:pantothenate kinase-related protein Tda10